MKKTWIILIVLSYGLYLDATTMLQAASLQVSHQARSVAQGEAVLLTVTSGIPLARMTATVFGKEFPLFPSENGLAWEGIIAIDLDCKPGNYIAEVRGWSRESGQPEATAAHTLEVTGKKFAERRLKVAEKYVSPPEAEMARINRETALTRKLFTLATPERFWSGSFLKPVPGGVTSPFGRRNFVNDQPRSPHTGVDLRGADGTPVKAPAGGKIIMAEELYFAGNTVMIDHGFGLISYLCHLSAIKVKKGDTVSQGEVIGLVGSTGRVTGPHLHWTIRLLEQRIDPMSLLELKF